MPIRKNTKARVIQNSVRSFQVRRWFTHYSDSPVYWPDAVVLGVRWELIEEACIGSRLCGRRVYSVPWMHLVVALAFRLDHL